MAVSILFRSALYDGVDPDTTDRETGFDRLQGGLAGSFERSDGVETGDS
jgi:hypothetical protein